MATIVLTVFVASNMEQFDNMGAQSCKAIQFVEQREGFDGLCTLFLAVGRTSTLSKCDEIYFFIAISVLWNNMHLFAVMW